MFYDWSDLDSNYDDLYASSSEADFLDSFTAPKRRSRVKKIFSEILKGIKAQGVKAEIVKVRND